MYRQAREEASKHASVRNMCFQQVGHGCSADMSSHHICLLCIMLCTCKCGSLWLTCQTVHEGTGSARQTWSGVVLQAQMAYLAGNKGQAKQLSMEGRAANERMHAAHAAAASAIYQQRNPSGDARCPMCSKRFYNGGFDTDT